jgi:hypothetical protein
MKHRRKKVKGKISKRTKAILTPKVIKTNAGFLGTKGKLLKSLMEEKKKEKNL